MDYVKLTIRIPTDEASKKIVIDILTSYGYDKKDAKLAVENITDKNNVDEAVNWLFENKIFPNDLAED